MSDKNTFYCILNLNFGGQETKYCRAQSVLNIYSSCKQFQSCLFNVKQIFSLCYKSAAWQKFALYVFWSHHLGMSDRKIAEFRDVWRAVILWNTRY